ncbi:hypothetical protein [Dysgonomonas sp. HGC4]|uniref:hypothetical protein n=2 Tax=Dysgonomonas sp. HGC4 TaxID=1658009 RepID=UPI000A473B08|nr:hypothetical protein [Dysgonomonas sp. HGC4]
MQYKDMENVTIQATEQKIIFSNSFRNRKPATENQLTTLQEKREKLKKLSKPLKKKVEKGTIENINQGLKALYSKQGHTELKTLSEWNKAGYSVIKGEHALLLWGKKKTRPNTDENAATDSYKFNPICFVFSQLQVKKREVKYDTASN